MKSVKCPEYSSNISLRDSGNGRCPTCNAHVKTIDYNSAGERDNNEMW